MRSSLEWHNTYYTESYVPHPRAGDPTRFDLVQEDEPLHRKYFMMQSRILGPVFSKVWNTPDNGYADRYKHLIEPEVTISRSTMFDNTNIIKLEGYDYTFGGTTRVTYGLTNRFLAKRRTGGTTKSGAPTTRTQEFLNVTVQQSYYTNPNASQYDGNYSGGFIGRPPSNYSPVALVVRASPSERFNSSLRMEYSTQEDAFETISADGTVQISSWLTTGGNYSQRKYFDAFDPRQNFTNFLGSRTVVRLAEGKVSGYYDFQMNAIEGDLIQQRLGLSYNAQCCGVAFEYQAFNFPDSVSFAVPQDRRFSVSFTLAGIGTFSNFLGAFGIGQGANSTFGGRYSDMTEVLVTGGAGFIGSNFVRYAIAAHPDWHVTTLDKLTYAGRMENLRDVIDNPRHTFVKGDIADREVAAPLVHKADYVVHFAAETHVDRSILHAADFITTDVIGTFVLLEAAREAKHLKTFVQISTDEVYGSVPEGSSVETDELRPRNPYSASKAGADRLAYSYWATHDVPVIVTRASNNYGPNQFPEKVIPLFITNAMENLPVPLYGDGQNVRDWLHVEDHCRGVDMLLTKGEPGQVYNIGGGNEVKNVDLTHRILEILGKPSQPDSAGGGSQGPRSPLFAVDGEAAEDGLGADPRFRRGAPRDGEVVRSRTSRGGVRSRSRIRASASITPRSTARGRKPERRS